MASGSSSTIFPASPTASWSAPSRAPISKLQSLNDSIAQFLLFRLQRMFRLLEELILQSETFLVRLHGADRVRHSVRPCLHIELPESFVREARVSRVMIGKFRIPPDPCVHA